MGFRRQVVYQRVDELQNYDLQSFEGFDLDELFSPSSTTFDDSDTLNDPEFRDAVSMDNDDYGNGFYDSVAAQITSLANGAVTLPERWSFLQELVGIYQKADITNSATINASDVQAVLNFKEGNNTNTFEQDNWIREHILPYNTLSQPSVLTSRFDQNRWYTRYDSINDFDSIGRALVGTDSIGYHGITQWW